MTIDRSAATLAAIAAAPVDLSPAVRHTIFLYLGILIILATFGAPWIGLIDIPVSFFLKNKLHLTAPEVANFRLVAAIPLYLSFVFGFVRDMWNPLGMRDRGFILLFGGISALLYVVFAFTPMSYATLIVGVVLLTVSSQFVASAQNGLTSVMGQQHAMSGQISAVWNVFLSIPTVASPADRRKAQRHARRQGSRSRGSYPVSGRGRDHGGACALWAVEAGEVFDNIRVENGPAGIRSGISSDWCGTGRSIRPC